MNNLVDNFISKAKNNKILSFLVIVGIIVFYLGVVSGALNEIFNLKKNLIDNDGSSSNKNTTPQVENSEVNITTQKQEKIGNLIALAADDLNSFRLTTPKNNNAYDKYKLILRIDPGNELAKLGLIKVGNTYLNLVKSSIANSDFKRSYRYLSKGKVILGDTVNIKELEKEIKKKDEKLKKEIKKKEEKLKKEQLITNNTAESVSIKIKSKTISSNNRKEEIDALVASIKNIQNDSYAAQHLINSIKLVPGGVNGAELATVILAAEISNDASLAKAITSSSIYLVQPVTAKDIESILSTIQNDYYQLIAAKSLYKARTKGN